MEAACLAVKIRLRIMHTDCMNRLEQADNNQQFVKVNLENTCLLSARLSDKCVYR